MPTSRNHQGAHGIGQAEEQIKNQHQAAGDIQGTNQVDQRVDEAARRSKTELDEIIDS
ncbi:hypothetical protein [Paenibacillus tarimensis]|uniref:hypothetical protein n=1 Tax=Paenibacillus tarimensis TaxID=416012 RepID=UPI001F411156|nr:hypothetical protein [Paenibacillus tarimensis]MCF2942732.1 hypothetical protein [Paenibacillus tarimensis]